ncbi:Rv3654c family TadE-like protein [Streptomyces boninensis]|uniref:Rv3654c family TadE-like protein n=1 Tax=Streptomyces boninensis TaxID=2039455 RepID=UPI003B21F7D6
MRKTRWADGAALRQRGVGGTDRGSATVWTAVVCAALCAVFLVLLGVGQAVLARHRAGAAADLAALAAADTALRGPEAACTAARRVAAAQGATLVRCALTGEVSDVSAAARAGPFEPQVRSRAGPANVQPTGPRSPLPSRQQRVQQSQGARLAQGVVAVAALRGLDAGRAA